MKSTGILADKLKPFLHAKNTQISFYKKRHTLVTNAMTISLEHRFVVTYFYTKNTTARSVPHIYDTIFEYLTKFTCVYYYGSDICFVSATLIASLAFLQAATTAPPAPSSRCTAAGTGASPSSRPPTPRPPPTPAPPSTRPPRLRARGTGDSPLTRASQGGTRGA